MQTPAIKSVEIEKNGRFWAVNVDGQMLAIVLYKRGALAVQDMVRRLGGLAAAPATPTVPSTEKSSSNPTPPKAPKPAPKTKAKKPSQKSTKKS